MWSESMLKYNTLNQKYLELQQQRKDIIWQMWDVWRLMNETERAHFTNQHEVECNCDAPPSEQ